MRILLILLSLVLQWNVSGNNINIPQENCVQKTLNVENSEINGRSYVLFRYYSPEEGMYLSQDPIFTSLSESKKEADFFGKTSKVSMDDLADGETGIARELEALEDLDGQNVTFEAYARDCDARKK
jgi:hypothetical protein